MSKLLIINVYFPMLSFVIMLVYPPRVLLIISISTSSLFFIYTTQLQLTFIN